MWKLIGAGLSLAGIIVGWFADKEEHQRTVEETKQEVLAELSKEDEES